MTRLFTGLLILSATAASAADPPALSAAKPININDARTRLGLLPHYATVPRINQIKVAVLDSGFAGVKERPYLPQSAVLVESYDPEFVIKFNLGDPTFQKALNPGDAHGRQLAQLVWAVTGNSPDGPKFYLLNANGPTLFRRAVKAAIEAKVDVILFGGTFEGAGNYDGKGPINAAVDEAVAAGILWVNAAGNCGGLVYDGPINLGPDSFLRFGTETALHLRNRLDEHAVTVTLTWNDYKETDDAGTTKDLDLFMEDAGGKLIGQSTLRQLPPGKKAGDGQTTNPRERLTLVDLAATPTGGEYRIRVKSVDSAFGPTSRLRVLVTPTRTAPMADQATGRAVPTVELLQASHDREIYPPADHPGVLTVGDATRASAVGPTADGRQKPDIVLDSSIALFSNGEESGGSSNAAAYFAGVLAVLKAAEPTLTAAHVRAWVKQLDQQMNVGKTTTEYTPPVVRYATQSKYIVITPANTPGVYPAATSTPPASVVTTRRAPPPHAAWQTPTPATLSAIIRGK